MRERTDTASGRVLADGRYVLGARLGGGGTADVYRALDTVLARPVAIKLFRAGSGVRDEERFQQEAQLLAPLSHPGLVTVYDAGVAGDGEPYLVLQLVDGLTLRQRLARGRLTPDEVATLGGRLASVLAYVHSRGIVHRDVKPANVLISAETGQAHLADFGISRLIDNAAITATGLVVGTVAYMAPEQVQGKKVDPPADMYSLGLVLLECLTGRVEYPGGNAESAVARLSRGPAIPAHLPEDLRWALESLTATEPGDRITAVRCAALLGDGRPAGEVTTDYLVPPTGGFVLPNGHGAFLAPPGQEPALPSPARAVTPVAGPPPGPATGAGPSSQHGGPSTGGNRRQTVERAAPVPRHRGRLWIGGAALLLTVGGAVAAIPHLNAPLTSGGQNSPPPGIEREPDGGPGRNPGAGPGVPPPAGGPALPSTGDGGTPDPSASPTPTPSPTDALLPSLGVSLPPLVDVPKVKKSHPTKPSKSPKASK